MLIGRLEVPDSTLTTLCRKWQITRMDVFGSVLRADFGPQSDVDLLVDFDTSAGWSLMDLVKAEREFSTAIGRQVQLVERAGLLRSQNTIRKKAILESAQVVYGA